MRPQDTTEAELFFYGIRRQNWIENNIRLIRELHEYYEAFCSRIDFKYFACRVFESSNHTIKDDYEYNK